MREKVRRLFGKAIEKAVIDGALPGEATGIEFAVDSPRNPAHGDYAVNAAMILAKAAKRPPREVAQLLIDRLVDDEALLKATEIAGPGFINLRLDPAFFVRELRRVEEEGERFGHVQVGGNERVLVEYVSANPTGPMHVGHGRGAVTGDAVSRLLAAAGYEVVREYYVNDAGGQITALARSTWIRARECYLEAHPDAAFGEGPTELGEDDYKGDYIKDVAREVMSRWSEEETLEILRGPFEANRDRIAREAVAVVLDQMIKPDLEKLGIRFDSWFSESSLHESRAVERAIADLETRGFVETKVLPPPKGFARDEAEADERPQLVFLSSQFGDDADRPLRKGDGGFTYFAGDVAYHWDKLQRGHQRLINVWGADHAGYVPRVRAAIQAMGRPAEDLEVILVQMVNLLKQGQPVKMGKRSGNFIRLRWLLDEVGKDAVRVFFLMRRNDAMLDFDVDLAKAQSKDNPVFYVQYGHARCASILRKAVEEGHARPSFRPEHAQKLTLPEEIDLAKGMLDFPEVVAAAARAREPHRIVFYIQEVTALFQHYYEAGKRKGEKVISDDQEKTAARLYLIASMKRVFANALELLGVSAPERMERLEEEGE